ncbi:MAG TPA: hypothetical protein VGR48_17735 [Terriglobales bacterium]|nr:hypothetical protein [Terriglobales bacterium]
MPQHVYPLLAAGLATAAILAYLLRRRRKTPEEVERERRAWISKVGRITDGTVIDVNEMDGTRPAQFIIYQYDVAGVSYEASQEITYLRQYVNLHSCRLGLPTSVKYDPHNPGNSIVVSESWFGLRRK